VERVEVCSVAALVICSISFARNRWLALARYDTRRRCGHV
jgi:hypothetical protein